MLTEKQKQALTNLAKVTDCQWFELAVDDYGEDCVFNNQQGKKYKLYQGFRELMLYNYDVAYFAIEKERMFVFEKGENQTIKQYDAFNKKYIIPNKSFEDLINRYPDVDKLNNLLTPEEREICRKIYDEESLSRNFPQNRLVDIIIGYIEKNCFDISKQYSELREEIVKKLDVTEREARHLVREFEKRRNNI